MTSYNDEAMGWSDRAEVVDSSNFTLLTPGEYHYRVIKFERQRYDGGAKMGPCPMAVLTLAVGNAAGEHSDVQVRLFLNRKVMFRLTEFFKSCGLIAADLPEGSSYEMPWDRVVGAMGKCVVKNRQWTGSDGKVRDGNEVDRFVVPEHAPAQATRYGEDF